MKTCCKYIQEFKVSGIWNINTTLFASMNGHLDCIKYARKNGCPWSSYTTANAACHGHLDCLKYAHENGCSWNIGTTSKASYYGQLDCLKYAHENGCPWHEQTTLYAASHGHLDCIKYALENGCPLNKQTTLSTLAHLEKHVSKIDLDDKWWRSFLFEQHLTTTLNLNLKNIVDTKKEEIRSLQEETTLLFFCMSKDITQYVVWSYI
jgi:hypothetical protein